jgi:hypothetical protein
MKKLALLMLLSACAAPQQLPSTDWTDQEKRIIATAQEAMNAYYHYDFKRVYARTTIRFVPVQEVIDLCGGNPNTIGCYWSVGQIDIDESQGPFWKCKILIHEYAHAVGYDVFDNIDPDHIVFYDIYYNYSYKYCGDHEVDYL